MTRLGMVFGDAARRLQRSGDPLIDSLFEALPPTVMLDAEGAILRLNAKARAVLPDGAPGGALLRLLPDARREAVADSLRSAFAGMPADGAFAVTRLPGGRAVLLHLPPDLAAEGAPEQRETAQRLQALGQLVGGIAHDFNNLLTAIAACATAAEEAPDDLPGEMTRIRDATRRGADLARRLLAFGRQQTLLPVAVDANRAVRGAADLLRPLMGARIAVDLTLEEPGRSVHVDPTQFDQVLVNLAVNARDAMERGGRLTLSTGHATLLRALPAVPEPIPPGRWVTIAVADTGAGIPADVLPRIFEPFFSTRTARAGATGGTGLGLSTVHGILRQSGGFLSVQTAPGAGTTMTVYLPRWDGVPVAPAPVVAAGAAGGGGRVVLLVEDEDMIRGLAARTLARRGWTVHEAACGEDALDLLGDGVVPDVVVSDMMMPGMDGVALVRAVRARTRRADLPAILVSGYAAESQRAAIAELRATFIAKPYDMATLAERLAGAV